MQQRGTCTYMCKCSLYPACMFLHKHTQHIHTHPLFWERSALRNTPTCSNTPPVQRAHAHTHNQPWDMYVQAHTVHMQHQDTQTHPYSVPTPVTSILHAFVGREHTHAIAWACEVPAHPSVFASRGLWLVLAELQPPSSAWHRHSCGPKTCPGRGRVCAPKCAYCMR